VNTCFASLGRAAVLGLVLSFGAGVSRAQSAADMFPSKPIRIIVPFAAGGSV